MTVLTALTIASNYPDDISVLTGGQDGKFAGFIYLMREGRIHTLLISSDPIFSSKDEAETTMNEVIQQCLAIKF